ncbi:hypothetical protein [Nostoc sp.]|uniref:hypothetical protein n=1 Tax=Nostoc sp. TaxID=1180 RepID=UPI002FF51919
MRDLGEDEKANEIIEIYIQQRKDEEGIFDIANYPFSDDINDKRVIERFKQENTRHKNYISPEEVIDSLVGKNGWSQSDIEILSSLTTDDFYQIFTSQNGDHLSSWVDVCLQFARIVNASEKQKMISNNATEALVRIGRQSRLNARRVSKYGIRIKDDV